MPKSMLPAIMRARSSAFGILSPSNIMSPALAMPPTSICPSAPIFQKRMRKAGVRPTAIKSSTPLSRIVTQRRRGFPIAPETSAS